MSVIAYDKPVANFIAQLNATTHVTNVAYRKTSVTFHHNGGRLSLQGILDVWKVRPASAHFQVDGQGRLGQYVKINEYAWATGNTTGNKESISIELANATLSPTWTVAETTWREGARLCGWIHAKVLGVRPSRKTVKIHSDWKATLCAGPHIRSILDTMIAESQKAYDYFKANPSASAPKPAALTKAQITARTEANIGDIVDDVIAGKWGTTAQWPARLAAAKYDPAVVKAGVERRREQESAVDVSKLSVGQIYSRTVENVGKLVDEVIAGKWGNNPERSRKLLAAGWSPTVVQEGVVRRLGRNNAKAAVRPSNTVLAQQVINGQWGEGPDRKRRLTAAGYDYEAIQAEVNRLL